MVCMPAHAHIAVTAITGSCCIHLNRLPKQLLSPVRYVIQSPSRSSGNVGELSAVSQAFLNLGKAAPLAHFHRISAFQGSQQGLPMGPIGAVLGKLGRIASALRPRRKGGQPLRAASKEFLEAEGEDLWLLVGLGNPGSKYDETRHNVGFMLIDTLARHLGIHMDKLQHSAAVGRGRLCDKRVLLAKPMTFMNNSGESVGKLARYYKVPLQRVLVVYDDMDMPHGTVRLRAKGGHGGHNGMRSITQHFSGSKDFPRLRLGIGRPAGRGEVISHVLQGFTKKEREDIDFAIQDGIDTIKAVLALGMEKALSGVRVPR